MRKHKKHHSSFLAKHREWRKRKFGTVPPLAKWWVILFIAVFLVIDAILYFEFVYADKFYPGVIIGDTNVGGKTYGEVISYFTDRARVLKDTGLRINFLDGGAVKDIKIPMSAQGLTPDKSFEYFSVGEWEKTVQKAYQFGKVGSLGQRFSEQASLLSKKNYNNLPFTLYEVSVDSFLSQELDLFLKKTQPARFAVNENGDMYIVSEKIGEKIDKTEIIRVLKKKLALFDVSSENFKTEMNIPITTGEKLAPFLGFAKELSRETGMIFRHDDYRWKAKGATLATWLTITESNTIGLDDNKIDAFFSKTVTPEIENAPKNSRFEMRNGKLKEIIRGRPGNIVNIADAEEKAEKIILEMQKTFRKDGKFSALSPSTSSDASFDPETGAISIPIEISVKDPRITQETIDQYKISDLVGSAKTGFKGSSADRITNITVGASKLNGLLIAPDEEFSAVNSIGYVNEEAGYVKEYVIKDNASVKEFGGGLCQIATTLFRTVLNAGLPVTERANHRYVVSYYGPGLDATIYGPHPDLRFVNDTGHYLLLQTKVIGNELLIELYGQKDDRKITISEPVLSKRIPAPVTKYIPTFELRAGTERCSETPRSGVTADVTYSVTLPNGNIREQHFNSVYQPWRKICLMGIRK
jgi:vancomycin resistance protein YoaR